MAGKTHHKLSKEVLKAVQQYHEALEVDGIPVEQLLVFGSQAKGTQHEWSDIDVAVVSSIFGRDRFEERGRLMRLGDNITTAIEPHPFHPDDLNNRWSALAQEIKKYGIRVD